MKRSLPIAPFWLRPVLPSLGSVFGRQFSVLSGSGFLVFPARHTLLATRHSRRAAAFTLLELLIVIAIIAILASLTLAAMGGINQRAARDRAKGEVAAVVNAIQSYQLQNGVYPPVTSNGIAYTDISGFLGSARIDTDGVGLIVDPYGNAYVYRTNGTMKNPASFDVYSKGVDPIATNGYIGNW